MKDDLNRYGGDEYGDDSWIEEKGGQEHIRDQKISVLLAAIRDGMHDPM